MTRYNLGFENQVQDRQLNPLQLSTSIVAFRALLLRPISTYIKQPNSTFQPDELHRHTHCPLPLPLFLSIHRPHHRHRIVHKSLPIFDVVGLRIGILCLPSAIRRIGHPAPSILRPPSFFPETLSTLAAQRGRHDAQTWSSRQWRFRCLHSSPTHSQPLPTTAVNAAHAKGIQGECKRRFKAPVKAAGRGNPPPRPTKTTTLRVLDPSLQSRARRSESLHSLRCM